MDINLRCRQRFYPFSFVYLHIVFSVVGGDYCTNTALYLAHINNVYGALHCALLLMIATPAQKALLF
jgi:hypothetical protein